MEFELSEDQKAILDSVEALVARHAGAERAIALAAKAEYDGDFESALVEAGFFELGVEAGPLEAALMVEAAARGSAVAAVGARALVAPQVSEGQTLDGPVALARAGTDAPVRFGAHARYALVLDGDAARLVSLTAGDTSPVRSNFGFPMGRIDSSVLGGGEDLGPGSGDRLRRWWRVATAVETAGTLRAALDVTLRYVKERRQFGRAIGSFQGVQHRLAYAAVQAEGARWLALEAADLGAPEELSAVAAAYAAAAAKTVFDETHQFSGAMGFTREHDLHVSSMRLQALRLELGGVEAHRRAVALSRWPVS
ncbi:MAG: acyl-CoA dehydrogenase [Deltaproteobacteria bacterium]|nr:acyl-CoA dehydrogenase [Deltaproteobacteria bacterium]MBW2446987.1 acyl-CoA dehydrogenase [Deltaproteobacteria bacterium]